MTHRMRFIINTNMNFDLTTDQEALRQRVRDFAEQEVKPVARENDEDQHFDVGLTLKMAELGLLGMTVPKDYGGQGLDNLSYIIAVEELARVDESQSCFLPTTLLGSRAIRPWCGITIVRW